MNLRKTPANGAAASLMIPVQTTAAAPMFHARDREHDGECVGNDRGHIVAVDVGGDVGSCLALCQARCKKDQPKRPNQKSECVAGEQMCDAESGRDSNREQQENRDHRLREIEAELCDGGVKIASAECPPALRHWLLDFK
jgi:hypothetical protein